MFAINFYSIFRFVLLGFSLYSSIQLGINAVRYKPYYDRLPDFLKQYLLKQGSLVLSQKVKEHQRDFLINGLLLAVLLLLNLITFIY